MMVYWQEADANNGPNSGYNPVLVLLKKQNGFSRKLLELKDGTEVTAYIDGPYRQNLQLDTYGTVIFILEDIGIAAATMHIRELLKKSEDGSACVQCMLCM